ncbi:hypothetical protein LINPERHAP1_LOCUS21311 [Linum perenne]
MDDVPVYVESSTGWNEFRHGLAAEMWARRGQLIGSKTKGSNEGTRDYKIWSRVEEQTLIACMREMADAKLVVKGNFRLRHLKSLEKMLIEKVENCQASGIGWDDARGCVVADDKVFAGWVKDMMF